MNLLRILTAVWSTTTPSLSAMSETLHSTYKVILTS
jgi:hypothetical protein